VSGADGTKLALGDAVTKALDCNNSYKIALSKVTETEQQVNEAWGALWPSASTDASYSKIGASFGSSKNIDSQYSINVVNASISVNPGAVYNTIQSARDGRIIAENNLRTVKQTVEKTAIQQYYNLILARETVKIQNESNSALLENLKTVTAGYQAGRVSKVDYLTAKLSLTNSDTDLINAKSSEEVALGALNITLGCDVDAPISPDGTFGDIPADEKKISSLEGADKKAFINQLVAESLRFRPELISKKAALDQYDRNAAVQASTYMWPTFSVTGKYTEAKNNLAPGANTTSSLTDKWTDSWSITFGASYKWGSLSPLDASHAKEKQQAEKRKQTQYDLEDFLKQVNLDVLQNYSSMCAAFNSIQGQKENVTIAEENLRASQIQFRSGLLDNKKFLDANVQLITTKKNYIQALVNYAVAKSALNSVIGRDYFRLY
jgi:outer membrane protein TolC